MIFKVSKHMFRDLQYNFFVKFEFNESIKYQSYPNSTGINIFGQKKNAYVNPSYKLFYC